MNQKLSVAQLKSVARGQLLGRYGIAIGADVTANGIIVIVSLLCSALTTQNQKTAGAVIAFLITLLLDILSGIFLLGLARFYLNLVCSRPLSVMDVFYGFRHHTDKALITRALIVLMELIVMLPFLVCTAFYRARESSVLFLFSCITLVIGGILYVYIILLYSQAYYILAEHPEMSGKEALDASIEMMDGHKMDYFVLLLSFIPWILLCTITCGLAVLYVYPYMDATLVNFYQAIKQPAGGNMNGGFHNNYYQA